MLFTGISVCVGVYGCDDPTPEPVDNVTDGNFPPSGQRVKDFIIPIRRTTRGVLVDVEVRSSGEGLRERTKGVRTSRVVLRSWLLSRVRRPGRDMRREGPVLDRLGVGSFFSYLLVSRLQSFVSHLLVL